MKRIHFFAAGFAFFVLAFIALGSASSGNPCDALNAIKNTSNYQTLNVSCISFYKFALSLQENTCSQAYQNMASHMGDRNSSESNFWMFDTDMNGVVEPRDWNIINEAFECDRFGMPTVPEFGALTLISAMLVSAVMFFFLRRK